MPERSEDMSNDVFQEPLIVGPDGLRRLGVPFSNQHLLRLEAQGKWPRRLSLGARRVCWQLEEVKGAIARRAAERESAAAERSRAARQGVATREGKRKTRAILA